jgi:AcrR family transcriptional regulator
MEPTRETGSTEINSVRSRALSAASKILALRGVDELSLRAIAERAGVGIASIYHYFANKDDLLVNLAILGFADLHRHIDTFQAKPEFTSPMQACARGYFDFAEKQPALFSLMFSERLMANHEALRAAENKVLLVYQAAVEKDARIPPLQKANVAFALWALGRGIAAIRSSYPEGTQPPEINAKLFAGISYLLNHSE